MGQVINWPRHLWHGPRDHAPDDPARYTETCQACVLSFCKRCRAGEAELTQDCPGHPVQYELREAVQAGCLEYTEQMGWHNPLTGERLGRFVGHEE